MEGLFLSLIVVGLLLALGGWLDWEPLTDPPKLMAFFYSQAFLRLMFSRRAMRYVAMVEGLAMTALSAWAWIAHG